MTPVVIDASAGVEILANTAHGRRLARLLPTDAVGWVPEHFYVEVAGVVRHQAVVTRTLTEEVAEMVLGRLDRWHLRRALPGPLITAAWRFRQNMTMADAVYVALAAELGGALLTDDRRLVNAPGFPSNVSALTLDRSWTTTGSRSRHPSPGRTFCRSTCHSTQRYWPIRDDTRQHGG